MKACVLCVVFLGLISMVGNLPAAEKQPAEDGIAEPSPLADLLRPPADPDRGALYEAGIDLLSVARELPSNVQIWAEAPQSKQENVTELGENGWVRLRKNPVVPLYRLAEIYLRKGAYGKAGACYAKLASRHPEDRHSRVMRMLCRRMSGESGETETGGETSAKPRRGDEGWIDWIQQVDKLSETLHEGEEK